MTTMAQTIQRESAFLRRKQVETRTGLSRSTIYQCIKDGVFPNPRRGLHRWLAFERRAALARQPGMTFNDWISTPQGAATVATLATVTRA